jgi:hypothetical protein
MDDIYAINDDYDPYAVKQLDVQSTHCGVSYAINSMPLLLTVFSVSHTHTL